MALDRHAWVMLIGVVVFGLLAVLVLAGISAGYTPSNRAVTVVAVAAIGLACVSIAETIIEGSKSEDRIMKKLEEINGRIGGVGAGKLAPNQSTQGSVVKTPIMTSPPKPYKPTYKALFVGAAVVGAVAILIAIFFANLFVKQDALIIAAYYALIGLTLTLALAGITELQIHSHHNIMESRFSAVETKIEARFLEVETKIEVRFSEVEKTIDQLKKRLYGEDIPDGTSSEP